MIFLFYRDVYNKEFKEDVLKYFCVDFFVDELMTKPRTPYTTDRESSIFFGLPSTLIEGVLVGRKYEQDKDKLDYIKSKLPDCYICNLDGKVIVENKWFSWKIKNIWNDEGRNTVIIKKEYDL